MGQRCNDFDRIIPADTGVSNGLTVLQLFFLTFNERLVAFNKIGLNHDAHDVVASVPDLLADVVNDIDLLFVLLVTVGVAGVNHDGGRKSRGFQSFANLGYAFSIVIRGFTAAKNNVAVFITAGNDNGGVTALGDRKEDMFVCGSVDCVDGDLDVAVSAVFESDRAGKAAG